MADIYDKYFTDNILCSFELRRKRAEKKIGKYRKEERKKKEKMEKQWRKKVDRERMAEKRRTKERKKEMTECEWIENMNGEYDENNKTKTARAGLVS